MAMDHTRLNEHGFDAGSGMLLIENLFRVKSLQNPPSNHHLDSVMFNIPIGYRATKLQIKTQ